MPHIWAKYTIYRTNPPSFPHLLQVGEVGHTIDRCIIHNDRVLVVDKGIAM